MRARLAIGGGAPVRETLLPYGRQSLDEEDIQAVVEVLRSDWLTTGPKVEEFEKSFADFVIAKEAVAVSNGTAALQAAGNDDVTRPSCESRPDGDGFVLTGEKILVPHFSRFFSRKSYVPWRGAYGAAPHRPSAVAPGGVL